MFSIIDTARIDSAKVLLESIDASRITTERDIAFYNMYKTMVYVNKDIPITDSLIENSIKYFENANDPRNLAQALFYKGQMVADGNIRALCYKKAEYNILMTDDDQWKYMVFWGLSAVNVNLGDKRLALEYTKKRYETAKKLTKVEVMCSVLSMAMDYHLLGEDDSARMYCDTLVSLGVEIDERLQSIYCNLMGELCLDTDRQKALEYFEEGVKHRYHQKCWKNLSTLYVEMGKGEEAEVFIRKTLDSSCYEVQIDMLTALYDVEKKCGNYSAAIDLAERIIDRKDSLQQRISNCRVVEEQHRFDEKINEIEYRNKIARYVFCLFICLLVAAIIVLLNAYRKGGVEKKQLENDQKRMIYENTITRLRGDLREAKNSQVQSHSLISELQEKLREKEQEWKRLYAFGSTLQSEIDNNKSIVMWSNDDIEDFVNFYLSQNDNLRAKLKNEYNNLNLNDRLFLILEDLDKTTNQIGSILGVSVASVRMRKYRLKDKLINKG